MTTLTFTEGDDSYISSGSADPAAPLILNFLGGNDRLRTVNGYTEAHMGDGNDYVRLTAPATIFGDAGADRIDLYNAAFGFSSVAGGAGNDIFNIDTTSYRTTISGDGGNDRFNFFADLPTWAGRTDTVDGGAGNDLFVSYGHEVDRIYGGAGNDVFLGFNMDQLSDYASHIFGGTGDDVFRVIPGDTSSQPAFFMENPGEGTDTVQVAFGASYTLPDNVENLRALNFASVDGAPVLTGNDLGNRITGGSLDETLNGLGGRDTLIGGGGNDTLYGGDGGDWIVGGAGADTLYGGAGGDRFMFQSISDSSGEASSEHDFIADWTAADRIDLAAIDADPNTPGNQAFVFSEASFGLPAGEQAPGSVVIGGFGGELYVSVYVHGGVQPDMVIDLWSEGGESALTAGSLIL